MKLVALYYLGAAAVAVLAAAAVALYFKGRSDGSGSGAGGLSSLNPFGATAAQKLADTMPTSNVQGVNGDDLYLYGDLPQARDNTAWKKTIVESPDQAGATIQTSDQGATGAA